MRCYPRCSHPPSRSAAARRHRTRCSGSAVPPGVRYARGGVSNRAELHADTVVERRTCSGWAPTYGHEGVPDSGALLPEGLIGHDVQARHLTPRQGHGHETFPVRAASLDARNAAWVSVLVWCEGDETGAHRGCGRTGSDNKGRRLRYLEGVVDKDVQPPGALSDGLEGALDVLRGARGTGREYSVLVLSSVQMRSRRGSHYSDAWRHEPIRTDWCSSLGIPLGAYLVLGVVALDGQDLPFPSSLSDLLHHLAQGAPDT